MLREQNLCGPVESPKQEERKVGLLLGVINTVSQLWQLGTLMIYSSSLYYEDMGINHLPFKLLVVLA